MTTEARSAGRWYERENWPYVADRAITEDYAEWLNEVDWKLFCTFTFAGRVSDPYAIKTFEKFINRLEFSLKCDVGYARGDEKRFSGCGKPASPRHFHALLTCTAEASSKFVEDLWTSMAGNRVDGAGALVKPYDASLDGASYAMKRINQSEGGWDFGKLHLFHPSVREQKITKRMRRHLRRHPALNQLCR